jgi:hypothetical protein
LHGSEHLEPNGLIGAGHKRRRHGANDIGKATNGSSGEAEKTKIAKLETTSADNTTTQRKEGNGSGNSSEGVQAAAAMTAAMAVRAVERLAEAERRGF